MSKKRTKAKQSGFKQPDPTPEEIRERCWEIQREWNAHERRRRGELSQEVPVPIGRFCF
jgi:hypothetical protein